MGNIVTPKTLANTSPDRSVLNNCIYEDMALAIMVALAKHSNTWRHLKWNEFLEISPVKDTPYNHKLFDRVVDYTTSAENAASFSPKWKLYS